MESSKPSFENAIRLCVCVVILLIAAFASIFLWSLRNNLENQQDKQAAKLQQFRLTNAETCVTLGKSAFTAYQELKAMSNEFALSEHLDLLKAQALGAVAQEKRVSDLFELVRAEMKSAFDHSQQKNAAIKDHRKDLDSMSDLFIQSVEADFQELISFEESKARLSSLSKKLTEAIDNAAQIAWIEPLGNSTALNAEKDQISQVFNRTRKSLEEKLEYLLISFTKEKHLQILTPNPAVTELIENANQKINDLMTDCVELKTT